MAERYNYRLQCQPAGERAVDRYITVFVGRPSRYEVKQLRGAWCWAKDKRAAEVRIKKLRSQAQQAAHTGQAKDFLARLNTMVGWR